MIEALFLAICLFFLGWVIWSEYRLAKFEKQTRQLDESTGEEFRELVRQRAAELDGRR